MMRFHRSFKAPRLLLVLLLAQTACERAHESDGEKSRLRIALVATLPDPAHEELARLLEEPTGSSGTSEKVHVETFETIGDASREDDIAAEINQGDFTAVVCADASAARTMAGRVGAPLVAVVRRREMLARPGGAAADTPEPGPTPIVIETQPLAADVVDVIRRLAPAPERVGVVYTLDAPGAAEFMAEAPSLLARGPGIDVAECVLAPGACRNARDVRAALDENFAGFAAGDVLLALPQANTLKFAYVIRTFARERRLGLIGVGEFRPGDEIVQIGYMPLSLARLVREAIHALPNNPTSRRAEVRPARLPPDVVVRADRLEDLGLTLVGATP